MLGPLEARADGRPVPIDGGKTSVLLALLTVHAPEIVSVDRIVDALWGERPPATATTALQVYVSKLRKALGPAAIVTRAPGYGLALGPGDVDVARFERLAAEGRRARADGRPESALTALTGALALWRGEPLAEVSYAPFASAEIARLEEMRLVAIEDRIDAQLGLGRHGELVADLEGLVARNPVRERLNGQLMLALYRAGRQADALGAYQAARTVLVEELGIEPGRELRELHSAILRQDAALETLAGEGPVRRALRGSEPMADALDLEDARQSDDAGTGERRKTITALSVRLEPSSATGESLDPEALRAVTRRVNGDVATAVGRHGGTVETMTGDSTVAVFGLPTLHEDDALRAARAATDLSARLAETADDLRLKRGLILGFGIGISTGEVVTENDGGVVRVTGAPMTLASRLAGAAGTGDVVIDGTTRRLTHDELAVQPLGDPANEAYRVVGATDATPEPTGRFVSPMVGRERERRRLHDALERAVDDGSCQLFTVVGLAGVGKSRLVREFVEDIRGTALVARGRCLPYGEGITFWPLLEVVRDIVGVADDASAEDVTTKLARTLRDEDDPNALARGVAEVIGLTESVGADGTAAVLALFAAVARERPLVLVFDDIHWGEPTFLDLVEELSDSVRDAPILVVCLARPELLDVRPAWAGGKLNATTTLLEPLSEDECTVLFHNLAGDAELPGEIERRIADAAEGNPLFVEEMLSMLIDEGVLARREGRWITSGDVATVRVPPTIQALLAARLDQLEPGQRDVVRCAAVQGKVWYERAVAQLVGPDGRDGVADAIASLVRKELVRRDRASLGGPTYRFRHLLIRDAAYSSVPKAARAELHERFARWLEDAAGDRKTEYEEIVGYHLEQAYRYGLELGSSDATPLAREAAERLGAAGRRAFARSDAPAGVNLVSRAVALLPAEDPLRVDLVPNVRAVQGFPDVAWADRALTEAVEAAATTGDRRLAAHALVQRGLLRLFTAADVTPQESLQSARQALRVFDELGDDIGRARAWRLTAQAHYLARQAGPCGDASERALGYAQRAGDALEQREIVEWLGFSLVLGPAFAADAERRCRRLLDDLGDDEVLAVHLLSNLAYFVGIQGRKAEFEELMQEADRLARARDRVWASSVHFNWIAYLHTDYERAEHAVRADYEELKRLGEKSHFCSLATLLAQAVFAQGRYDEAEQLAHEAKRAARPNDVHTHIVWRSVVAKVIARRGELDEAERLGVEAVAIAETSDFLHSHADALTDLADVLELAGRTREAADLVGRALVVHERKGNAVGAERAQARLAELAG